MGPELRITLRPDEHAPGKARRALAATASDLPRDLVQTARLLISELVMNSVQHGAVSRGDIEVFVDAGSQRRLRVLVSEAASDGEPQLRVPGHDGGYGLRLVEHLAPRWGTERVDGHRHTWFELDATRLGA